MKYTIRKYNNKTRKGEYLAFKEKGKWHVYKLTEENLTFARQSKNYKIFIKKSSDQKKLHTYLNKKTRLIKESYKLTSLKMFKNENILLKEIFKKAAKNKKGEAILLKNKNKLYKNIFYEIKFHGKNGETILHHFFKGIAPRQLYQYLAEIKTKAQQGKLQSSDIQKPKLRGKWGEKLTESCIYTNSGETRKLNHNLGSTTLTIRYINRV